MSLHAADKLPAVTDAYPHIFNTAQVAALLAMSTQEVTRGAREGWLPAYRVGHVWRFDRDEVLAWVPAHPAGGGRQADGVDM